MSAWTDYLNRKEDKAISEYKERIIEEIKKIDITQSLINQINSGVFNKEIKMCFDHDQNAKNVVISLLHDEKFEL